MKKTCKICGKLFAPTNNRQKYCCPECAKEGKLRKQRENTRLPKNMRVTKEIYQWTKAIMGLTKDEYDILFGKIKRDFRYAKTDRERQLLRTRLTIIRDLRQHSGLYADLKKGCKTCRFWNKGKCNLGNKKENCKSWEQDPYLWVTEDRRGRKKAEDDYGELGFDSEEGDREDVYNDQENW